MESFLKSKNYFANYHYFEYLNGTNLFGVHCDVGFISILVALLNTYRGFYRSRVFTRGNKRDIVLILKKKRKKKGACMQSTK